MQKLEHKGTIDQTPTHKPKSHVYKVKLTPRKVPFFSKLCLAVIVFILYTYYDLHGGYFWILELDTEGYKRIALFALIGGGWMEFHNRNKDV